MADYNRFISYIYLYERGMKTINTGFAKVESRGGKCRINVTMKNMYHESHVKFSAYMFVRKDKQLVGIYLGDLTTENNTGAFDAVTNTENIEGSGYGLDQVNGMIIRGDNGKIYGTGWDDEALNVDAFVTLEETGGTQRADAGRAADTDVLEGVQRADVGSSSSAASSVQNAGRAADTDVLEAVQRADVGSSSSAASSVQNAGYTAGAGKLHESDARSAGQDMMRQMAFGKAHGGEMKNQTVQSPNKASSDEGSKVRSAAHKAPEKTEPQNPSVSLLLKDGDDEPRLMAESMEALARSENESSLFRSPYGNPGNTGGRGSRNHGNPQRSAGGQNVIIRPDAAAWQSAGSGEKDSSAAMEALATAVDTESLPEVTPLGGEGRKEAGQQQAQQKYAQRETKQASQSESQQEQRPAAQQDPYQKMQQAFQPVSQRDPQQELSQAPTQESQQDSASVPPQESQQAAEAVRRECPALEKLIDKGLRMYPFEDEQVLACIRMEPQDIGTLPMKYWYLANNSFLLHGYYSYRHLIMAKMGDGRYILGVPGVNYQREQFMAGMFGFGEFKPVQNHAPTGSEFGYWYMELSE